MGTTGIEIKTVGVCIEGQERQELSTCSTGTYILRGDTYYVTYKESNEEGDTQEVLLRFNDREVFLRKKGEVITQLQFIQGHVTKCVYALCGRELNMPIRTTRYTLEKSDTEFHLYLHYYLLQGEDYETEHEVILSGRVVD